MSSLFDYERLDVVVLGRVLSEDDQVIRESTVADPSLLSIEQPASLYLLGSCLQAGRITSVFWLRKAKAGDLIKVVGAAQNAFPLLIVTKLVDDLLGK